MEEQEQPQEVEQQAAEQPAEAVETTETPETSEPQAEATTPDEPVDEQGVPYKNRAAESQRRMESMQLEIQELKASMQQQTPVAPQQPQTPVDPKANLDKFVELGPDAWYEQRRQQERKQDLMQQADKFIYDTDPNNYKQNVQHVFDTAREWNIDLNANPVLGVKKVFELRKLQGKMAAKAQLPSPEKKAADKKRVADIKKTQPEGGAKPPAPPVDRTSESLVNLKKRGSKADVKAYLTDYLS